MLPAPRCPVPVADDRHRFGPRYTEIGVREVDRKIGLGVVLTVDPVAHVCQLGDDLISVQESRGHVQVVEVFIVQNHREVVAKRRRAGSNIDDDIPHGAARTAHEFRLAGTRTPVQPAYDTTDRSRLRVLHKAPRVHTGSSRYRGVEGPGKEAAFVVDGLRHKDQYTFEVGRLNDHAVILPRRASPATEVGPPGASCTAKPLPK